MSGVSIKYGDIAPEAKENFNPVASEREFDTLEQLKKYNLNFPSYENPCEPYSVLLDGTAKAIWSDPESINIGWWGEQLSDSEGSFAKPIVLTLQSERNYTSSGFTLFFDKHNNVYATHVNIHWYGEREGEDVDLGEKDFYPDNASYSCKKRVESFNKVVMTFLAINMPHTRLKLRAIDYGYGTSFDGNELRGVNLIQEINPISSEISINTADFTIDTNGEEYSFQSRQPLSIYFNGKLKATTFVKKYTRKSKNLWQIQSEDYIGVMQGTTFKGGIYSNKNAIQLLFDIFAAAKVPYEIDETFLSVSVSGYIPYTNCRDALMQVAFAIQAVVDTSNSGMVKVYALDEEVKQTIPLERIMRGQNFVDDDMVSAVEVYTHAYKEISETTEAYSAEENGTGENILVVFSEPLHDLIIENGDKLEEGNNYAKINARDGCVLTGQKYEHTSSIKTIKNPLVSETEAERVVRISDATLVSANNIDNVLEKCYNWITRVNQTNLRIVEGKHIIETEPIKYGEAKYGTFIYGLSPTREVTYDQEVNVGEKIRAETEYLGDVVGTLIKQTFNLNGGIIIKDAVLR